MPPANDDFANAQAVALDVFTSGTLLGSTIEANEYNSLDAAFGAGTAAAIRANDTYSVWYSFVPTLSGTLDVSYVADSSPIFFIVYQSSGGVDTQDTISFNGISSTGTTAETVTITVTGGATYYIEFIGEDVSVGGTDAINFSWTASSGGGSAPWLIEFDGTSVMTASANLQFGFSAAITGHATMMETLVLNSLFANIVGHGSIPNAVLSEDANANVTPYFGDPTIGAGGTVTAATGPYPNIYENVTAVAIIETIGAGGTDSKLINQYMTLFASDRHSADIVNDYILDPIAKVGTTPIHTCERWFKLRFQGPFNYVDGIRLWSVTDLSTLLPGWTLKYGTTDTYTTPTTSASSVATATLPASDPGILSRNVMDSGPVTGASDYFTKWIVVQATFDPAVGGPGPILGFTSEGSIPFALQLQAAWVES